MISFKYFVCTVVVTCLTALIISGCGSKGTTTKFRFTPIGSMEDSTTDPERLTKDLDVLLQSEDSKRRKMLREKAKAEAEKDNKSTGQKVDQIK